MFFLGFPKTQFFFLIKAHSLKTRSPATRCGTGHIPWEGSPPPEVCAHAEPGGVPHVHLHRLIGCIHHLRSLQYVPQEAGSLVLPPGISQSRGRGGADSVEYEPS